MESRKKYELIAEMVSYVEKENIDSFADLVEYAANSRYNDWFPLLCDDITCCQMISKMFK